MIPRNDNERMSAWLERAWLNQYLERALDEAETAWFEAYVLDKPHLLQAIETDTDLRDGLAAATVPDAAPALPPDRRRAPNRRWAPQLLALAATLALGVGIGRFATQPDPGDGAPSIANPARIVYDTMRGAESAPRFDPAALVASDVWLVEIGLPASATNIVLEIDGEAPRALRLEPDSFVSFVISRRRAVELGEVRLRYEAAGERRTRSIALPSSTETDTTAPR